MKWQLVAQFGLSAAGGAVGGAIAAAAVNVSPWPWQTFWMAAQACVTLLAFLAAAYYANIARQQLGAFHDQRDLARIDSVVSHKPIVVTIRVEHDTNPNDVRYNVLNVGRGTAINVWYTERRRDGQIGWIKPVSLGAIGPGERRVLFERAHRPLRDDGGEFRHVIAAEGIPSRTTRWTLTGNIRGAQQGNSMRHLLIQLREPNLASLEEVLSAESDSIVEQLHSMPITTD